MKNKHKYFKIILYNPIYYHGHLDGWMAMFSAILLNRGYKVYCITPDTKTLLFKLHQKGLEKNQNVTILPWPNTYYSSWQRCKKYIKKKLRKLKNTYVNRLEDSRINYDMPFIQRCKKRLAQLLVSPAYTIYSAIRRSLQNLKPTVYDIADKEADYLSPEDWSLQIKTILRKLPSNCYFLFNMYMDMYKTDEVSWKNFIRYCPLSWAGIRFVPSTEPREAYYSLPTLRGMCFLDKKINQVYCENLPKKRFACLPDVTDASLSDDLHHVVQIIKDRSSGRKVIFLGGSITKYKNIIKWYEIIKRADSQRFFFTQIGEIHYKTCSSDEQNILRSLAASPPENFFMYDKYLDNEQDFNACIAICDVIFAVYKDFRISSNMPGKAAAFEKPIMVSDKYLMGEIVRNYNLGASVPEDDSDAILKALEQLILTPPGAENFAAYRAAHNEEIMGQVLEQFFESCLN